MPVLCTVLRIFDLENKDIWRGHLILVGPDPSLFQSLQIPMPCKRQPNIILIPITDSEEQRPQNPHRQTDILTDTHTRLNEFRTSPRKPPFSSLTDKKPFWYCPKQKHEISVQKYLPEFSILIQWPTLVPCITFQGTNTSILGSPFKRYYNDKCCFWESYRCIQIHRAQHFEYLRLYCTHIPDNLNITLSFSSQAPRRIRTHATL